MAKARTIGVLALGVLGLDQATKWWALSALRFGDTTPVIPGIFHFTLVQNTGVAFGLFARMGGVVVAVAVAIVMALAIASLRPGPPDPSSARTWGATSLILGGAIGNLIDRFRFGGVVDFLDFRIWPVFNVADSCITVGAALMAWAWWRQRDVPASPPGRR